LTPSLRQMYIRHCRHRPSVWGWLFCSVCKLRDNLKPRFIFSAVKQGLIIRIHQFKNMCLFLGLIQDGRPSIRFWEMLYICIEVTTRKKLRYFFLFLILFVNGGLRTLCKVSWSLK
jgi:hypothetical protein